MSSHQQVKFLVVHKYFFLLLSFVVFLIFYPLSFENPIAISILHSLLVLTILKIAYIIQRNKRLFIANFCLGIAVISIFPMLIYFPNKVLNLIRMGLFFVFYGINIIIFLKDITHKPSVTQDIILGSLCVYIMIAALYAGIFSFIEIHYPGAFEFNTGLIKSNLEKTFNLAYFSFTTLTTVGFGDIVPRSLFAKSIVCLEQITGIFYFAVLVSRLVPSARARLI